MTFRGLPTDKDNRARSISLYFSEPSARAGEKLHLRYRQRSLPVSGLKNREI